MKRLYQLLISALLFLIPSNLFYVLTETGSRVNGLRVDYLLPKFYVSDLVIWTLIGVYLFQHSDQLKKSLITLWKKRNTLTLAITIVATLLLTRQFFAANPFVAVWTVVTWIKLVLLAYVLWQKRAVLTTRVSYITLAFTVLFQTLLAYWQWGTQSSFAQYWFLGETDLSAYAGLAKTTLGNIDRVLPYGTTAHPNVLGGFLAISIMLLLKKRRKMSPRAETFILVSILGGCIALLLTQSISALLTLLIGVGMYAFPKIYTVLSPRMSLLVLMILWVVALFLPINSENTSLVRRQYLNRGAIEMFVANPFAGVGMQQFTAHIENFTNHREIVRFVQPAHNVPMLFLAETGLLGALLLALSVTLAKHKKKLFTAVTLLAPVLFLDHYLLTLQTGLLLLCIWMVYVFAE